MNEKIGFCVIGCGRISHSHLKAIQALRDRIRLIAVADINEELARKTASTYGADAFYTDLDLVWNDRRIDAVVLTLPNHLHSEVAVAAAQAGKHVLVEKPMANDLEGCNAMIQAARQTGSVLAVGQCRRFFRGARKAKELLAELGGILSINSILGVFWAQPQTEWWVRADLAGGLVLGLNGPHAIDHVLWMMDEMPCSVYAETSHHNANWEGEDEAFCILRFSQGQIATIHLSFNMLDAVDEKTIVCPQGTMRLYADRTLRVNGKTVVEPDSEESTHYLDGGVEFRRQIADFVDAIVTGKPPMVSGEDGRKVVAVLDALRQSAHLHQPVAVTM